MTSGHQIRQSCEAASVGGIYQLQAFTTGLVEGEAFVLVPYSYHHWVVTPNGLITSSLKMRRKKRSEVTQPRI